MAKQAKKRVLALRAGTVTIPFDATALHTRLIGDLWPCIQAPGGISMTGGRYFRLLPDPTVLHRSARTSGISKIDTNLVRRRRYFLGANPRIHHSACNDIFHGITCVPSTLHNGTAVRRGNGRKHSFDFDIRPYRRKTRVGAAQG